ncbi:GNAT family N-acetyltransferase [Paenibacillus sacheonensis]|uniref:GNAT family N-acetyltransferase n=1 Tax=Paenibacillus sacheonensis TaxID=742054 RepID=A0A7X4YNB9_9BACL|nr:GNAT family N-acetyltransferase [Paenibacillus sacheonensis]MBM7565544.1 ribosomal protein S18 acetylase RimI-like enzyme [Paenibacillus sacheonensis]NBC69536.1 GNAT family N-acetyltransferase [Paenibacillus sacheonensis]
MEFRIRRLEDKEEIPYDLLLLADPSRELVEAYIQKGQCYLAYRNDEVVGEFVLVEIAPYALEIINIAVKEAFRRQGIGKRLMLEAIEEAKKRGAKHVEIGTGNSSVHPLNLYQSCGFRIIGIDKGFFIRNYAEEIYEDGIQCTDMIRLRLDL